MRNGLGFSFGYNPISVLSSGVTSLPVNQSMFAYNTFNKQQTGAPFSVLNAFSELTISTNATSLDIQCGTTMSSFAAAPSSIQVFVNGVSNQTIQFVTGDNNTILTKTITLPAGQKNVMFRLGAVQANNVGNATVLGQGILNVAVTPSNTGTISYVPWQKKSKAIVFLTDSIGVGITTTRPELNGYIPIMRSDPRLSSYDILSYGWGNSSINQAAGTPTLRNTIVSDLILALSGYTDLTMYLTLVTNDYGGNTMTPTAFQAALGALVDAISAQFPAMKINIVTALPRATETANAGGFTTGNFRTAQLNVASTRPAISIKDGTSIVTVGDLTEGLHPSNLGNMKEGEWWPRDILGLAQNIPVVFNGQYFQSDPAATGQITIPTSVNIALAGRSNWSIAVVLQRQRTAQNDYAFTQGNGSSNSLVLGYDNTNIFRAGLFSTNNYMALGSVNFNADLLPHHVVMTKSGTLYSLYEDGFLVAQQTISTAQQTTTSQIVLGAIATTYGKVAMDRLRIYNITLDKAAVNVDMNTITLGSYTNILAAYDFSGSAVDITGNGNNGAAGSTASFPTA